MQPKPPLGRSSGIAELEIAAEIDQMVKEAGLKSFPTPAGGPRQTRAYSVRVDKDGNELHHNFADRSKIKWASTNEGRPLCWVYAVDDQNVRSHDPINVTDAKALEASVAHLAAASGDSVFAPASGARGAPVAERVTFVVQKGEPAAWDDVLRTVATPASSATPDRRPYLKKKKKTRRRSRRRSRRRCRTTSRWARSRASRRRTTSSMSARACSARSATSAAACSARP